mmetsp:Transcript_16439/g.22719  ORF Transcript_16439/g.22719 Transcript_16439/m.22719 type:complete len:100 (-) Transcript_16439:351-650(-)
MRNLLASSACALTIPAAVYSSNEESRKQCCRGCEVTYSPRSSGTLRGVVQKGAVSFPVVLDAARAQAPRACIALSLTGSLPPVPPSAFEVEWTPTDTVS